jgi:hypothetical protein
MFSRVTSLVLWNQTKDAGMLDMRQTRNKVNNRKEFRKMKLSIENQLKAALIAGTPIIGITSPDILGLEKTIIDTIKNWEQEKQALTPDKKIDSPLIRWNGNIGLTADFFHVNIGVSKSGDEELSRICNKLQIDRGDFENFTRSFYESLNVAAKLEKNTILIYENAADYLEEPNFIAGLRNLRDQFSRTSRYIILVDSALPLPARLQDDIWTLIDDLPKRPEIEKKLTKTYTAARKSLIEKKKIEVPAMSADDIFAGVNALVGLSRFQIEQAIAVSFVRETMQKEFSINGFIKELWEQKRNKVNAVKGLKINDESVTFDDIGGMDFMKTRINDFGNIRFADKETGEESKFGGVVFIDEIDKFFGGDGNQNGSGGARDTSGVSQEMNGIFLNYTANEKRNIRGFVLIGPAGGGKSIVAKAAGEALRIPVIEMSLTEMKEGLVGASTANMARAFQIVDAISDGNILMIATCNSIGTMPPEFLRRFNRGIFVVDYPKDKSPIWKIYEKKYGIKRPSDGRDKLWSPAEIKNVAQEAAEEKKPLESVRIVPIAQSNKKQIEELYRQCSGNYVDAETGNVWYSPSDDRGKEIEPEVKSDDRAMGWGKM